MKIVYALSFFFFTFVYSIDRHAGLCIHYRQTYTIDNPHRFSNLEYGDPAVWNEFERKNVVGDRIAQNWFPKKVKNSKQVNNRVKLVKVNNKSVKRLNDAKREPKKGGVKNGRGGLWSRCSGE